MIKKSSKYAHIAPLIGSLTLAGLAFGALAQESENLTQVGAEQRAADALYTFAIAPGSLSSVIDAIAQQTGLSIRYGRELGSQKVSGLRGNFSASAALQQVVQVQGLAVQQTGPRSYMLASADAASTVQLPEAVVIGQLDTPDVKMLDQLDMRRGLRNDLAEAMTMIPSVRVADNASSSLQQGDLKPAEFSIRGAAAYQNKIMLDGASIDNMLDPANKENESNYTSVAGHSQSVFIDPRFVKELKVIDVNASAAEGNFTGGIVKAETQSYNGRNSFEVSQRRTQDSWTQFHVDKKQEYEFGDGAAQLPAGLPGEFQPKFKKSETALSGTTRVGDLGVFAGYSEKQAQIKQKQLVKLDFDNFLETGKLFKPGEEKSLDRHSRYAVVRTDLLEREYDLNASLAYSDYSEDSFLINYLDSDFSGQHNGLNLSVNFAQELGATQMDLNVNAGMSADERDFKESTLDRYKDKSIYDGAFVGGHGELANAQQSMGSSLGFITPLSQNINVKYGGEFKWSAYKQDRASDFVFNEYSPIKLAPSGRYFKSEETIYGKGKINFTSLNLGSYAELEGDHDRFFWRSGLRLERDGWLKNTNWAPRFLAGVYLDDNKAYQATIGANRYYGKSFLSYRLREKERRYITKRTRTSADADWEATDLNQEWQFRDLDTPYDEEYSIGLFGPALSGQAGLQLVQRRGRNQIRTIEDKISKVKSFDNSGSSDTYQVDLFWRSQTLPFAGVDWTVNSAFAWMDKKTDSRFGNRTGGYLSTTTANENVIYKGKKISRDDLPAGDFATPITANIDLISQAFNDRLFVRNSLSFTNGYRYIKSQGRKTLPNSTTKLDSYDIEKQGSTARWDMSVEYQLLASPSSPYIRTDLINVLDSKNVISAEGGTQLFGVGRQYWLELGYRF
ncbi:MAG TPA: TonB-dependent receptor plug domain-containing protein [Thiopseudomonas sp.]|nr:TonB-dependent receptor plug domain-containing protein [Thiopseudomonas sp.]